QVENRDAAAIGADIELLVPRFCQSGHLVSGQAVFFGAMYNLFGAGVEMEQPFPVPDPDTSVRRYFHAAGILHAVACYADDAVGSIEISDSDILNDDPNASFGVYIHRLHMVVDGTMTLMQQRNGDAHRVHSGSHFERQQAGFFAGSEKRTVLTFRKVVDGKIDLLGGAGAAQNPQVAERLFIVIENGRSDFCSYPHPAGRIVNHVGDPVIRKGVLRSGTVPERFELVTVVSVKAIKGAEPHKPHPILVNGGNVI